MPSFFTSSAKRPSPKKGTPTSVFAGLDDPFNFPTTKMHYNSRSRQRTSSPDSATDSGYGSIDDERPLSPKSKASSKDKRGGKWGIQSYEYQSEHNDDNSEREPTFNHSIVRDPDNEHEWKPEPRRTFTDICQDTAVRPKWYASKVYGRKMMEKEKSEGITDLQREMALVIRRPVPGPRKERTLLHPSPPPPLPPPKSSKTELPEIAKTIKIFHGKEEERRGRKPSTILHPSPPVSPNTPARVLRSPRNRSQTPLGLPCLQRSCEIKRPRHVRRPSVLHSCFSDTDSDQSDNDANDFDDVCSISSVDSDEYFRRAAGEHNAVILAKTAMVVRAQRVRVRSPGFKEGL